MAAELGRTPEPSTGRQAKTVLPVFVCPADAGPELNHRKSDHPKSSYHGVLGSETQLVTSHALLIRQNGTFFVNSHVSVEQMQAGSSQTLVVGECQLGPAAARQARGDLGSR